MRQVNGTFELNTLQHGVEITRLFGAAATITSDAAHVRSGIYAGKIASLSSGVASAFHFNPQGNSTVKYYSFAYKPVTLPSGSNTIAAILANGGGVLLVMVLQNSDGTLTFADEDGTIGTGSTVLATGQYYVIQIGVDESGGAGSHVITLRIGTTTEVTASNRSISNTIGTIRVGGNLQNETQTQGEWYFDDIIVNDTTGTEDNSWPNPDEHLIILRTNAAGDNTDWTPSVGNNWDCLDETPPDDADFVSTNTVNAIDDYNLTPSGLGSNVIKSVHLYLRGQDNSSAPSRTVVRAKSSSGGTVEESASINLPVSYAGGVSSAVSPQLSLYDLPGASTTQWTSTELDTAQQGQRLSVAGSANTDVSVVWLVVAYTLAPIVVLPSSIGSEESFGTPVLIQDQVVIPTSIGSLESFGVPLLIPDQVVIPTSIGSLESFGTPVLLIPFSYSDWVQDNDKYNVLLLELWPSRTLYVWLSVGGGIYKTTFPESDENFEIDFVRFNKLWLEKKETLAEVTTGSFFYNINTKEVYVKSPDGSSPNTAFMRGYYFLGLCSKPKSVDGKIGQYKPVEFNGRPYFPIISDKYSYTYKDIIPDIFDQFKEQPSAKIEFLQSIESNGIGPYDIILARDEFNGVPAKLRHGDGGTLLDYNSHKIVGTFNTHHQPAISGVGVDLNLIPTSKIFNSLLPRRTFTKELFPNCADSIVGVPIPIFRGYHEYMPAYCIDTVTLKYKFGDNENGTDAVDAVFSDLEEVASYSLDLPNCELTLTNTKVTGVTVLERLYPNGVFTSGDTRYFVVTAVRDGKETVISTEVSRTLTGTNNAFRINWNKFEGAEKYNVYAGSATGVYTLRKTTEIPVAELEDGERWEFSASGFSFELYVPNITVITYKYPEGESNALLGSCVKDILTEELGLDVATFLTSTFDTVDTEWPHEQKIYLYEQKPVSDFLRKAEQTVCTGNIYLDKENKIGFEILTPTDTPDVILEAHDILSLEAMAENLIPVDLVQVGYIPANEIGNEWYKSKTYAYAQDSSIFADRYDQTIEQKFDTFNSTIAAAEIVAERAALIGAHIPKRFAIFANAKLFNLRKGQFVQIYYPRGWLNPNAIFDGEVLLIRDITFDYKTFLPRIEVDDFFGVGQKLLSTASGPLTGSWDDFDIPAIADLTTVDNDFDFVDCIAHTAAGSDSDWNVTDNSVFVTTPEIDTTGANFLVIALVQDDDSSAPRQNVGIPHTPIDSKGNTWKPLNRANGSGGDTAIQYFTCTTPIVGVGHTFTASDFQFDLDPANQSPRPSIFVAAFKLPWTAIDNNTSGGGGSASNITSLQCVGDTGIARDQLFLATIGFNGAISGLSISDGYTITDEIVFDVNHRGGAMAWKWVLNLVDANVPTWSWTTGVPAISEKRNFHEVGT